MQQIREKKEKRIRSILIDEFRLSYIASMNFQPVEQPTEECSRPISPTAALASEIYPKQFAYMRRMEFNDPDAEEDKEKEETFTPRPYVSTASKSKKTSKNTAEKKPEKKQEPKNS